MISSGIFSASTPGSGGRGIFTVTVSPTSRRCDDFFARPSTSTRASSIRACTWVRLMSLRCTARKRSRRWPPASSLTAKVSCSEESSSDSKLFGISDCARIEVLQTGGQQHLARNRSAGGRSRGHRRALASQPAPPKECAGNDQAEAYNLHQGDRIVEHHGAARVASEEFDGAALHPIEKEVRGDDLPGKALALADPNKNQEIEKLRGRFVKLGGMQMNAERRSGQLRGRRISENHAPSNGSRLAITTPRGKTSQTSDAVAHLLPRHNCVH